MSGAGYFAALRRVTLPLAWPGLLASALYVFTVAIGAFDVPLVIGLSNRVFTFSTYLYVLSNPLNGGVPRYGVIAAFSTFMILFALLLSWLYGRVLVAARRYQVISGKGYRPTFVALGNWRFLAWTFVGSYFLIAKIMPLAMMAWASLLPYFQPFSMRALSSISLGNYLDLNWSLLSRGLANTAILMIAVPTIALTISVAFSWVVLRSRNRLGIGFDFIAFLPHAVPSTIFAFVALVFSLSVTIGGVDFSGSLALIVIIMALVMVSFGTRITNGALIQIDAELEEAAFVSGARLGGVLKEIIFPLLRPALLLGWLWMALLAFRELTIPTMLFSAGDVVLSVVVWSLWYGGGFDRAAAANLVMMAVLLPIVVLYVRMTRRTGLGM